MFSDFMMKFVCLNIQTEKMLNRGIMMLPCLHAFCAPNIFLMICVSGSSFSDLLHGDKIIYEKYFTLNNMERLLLVYTFENMVLHLYISVVTEGLKINGKSYDHVYQYA